MIIDYLIIGQGICGTFLSYYLKKAGKKILVVDYSKPHTASKAASGVINPVTGRRIVKTWMIEDLLSFAQTAYNEIGDVLHSSLIQQCNVLDFHPTPQMQQAFEKRMQEDVSFLRKPLHQDEWQQYFRYNYGIGEIDPCLLIDLQTLLSQWRKKLLEENNLLDEKFDWQQCKIEKDKIIYKDITAEKILCCEGVEASSNPYFQLLPFAMNKGEAIIAEIPGLPQRNIYKQGISIVPWKEDNLFWIGSTYEWNYNDLQPTASFKRKVEEQLNYWLKLPYRILDHFASERPANIERRPFVGLHPVYPSVGILNGMGTKGCSLAPYFAHQFTQHLINKTTLEPLADVKRFTGILSR
jgi:glycine/D-amino acid oxidase-like deaminating enzyme